MLLTQSAYIDASNIYESSLEHTFKKENGIFYTDLSLAERMLLELRADQDAVIIDPCCGSGVFLYAAKKHGYNNLFGIDIDENMISFCSKNILCNNFFVGDSIGQPVFNTLNNVNLENKPDIIIGNPPYVPLSGEVKLNSDYLFARKVSDSGNNLFVAALIRALDMVKLKGIVSYIIPKNFLHVASYSSLRKDLLQEKTILSIVDIGAYFKDVRGEQIILTLKNSVPTKNNIKIKKLSGTKFTPLITIPQKFYTDEILLFNCKEDFSIYKKLSSLYQNISDLCNGYVGRGKSKSTDAISGRDIRKFGYKNKRIPLTGNSIFIQNIYSAEAGIIAAFGGNMNASQTVTVFTDGDKQMCEYILGILHSRLCNLFLYKYCYNYSKLTMHTDAKYLKKIPLPKQNKKYFNSITSIVSRLENYSYMNQQWLESLEELNQVVYEAYDVSKQEANYIDSEMKRIQSKRWIIDG